MYKQNDDSVFQLSLTEIAFTIIFLLILLLGLLVLKEYDNKEKLQADLQLLQEKAKAQEVVEKLFDAINEQNTNGLNTSQPEDILKTLVETKETQQENERLKQIIEALNDKITALEEIKIVQDLLKDSNDNLRSQIAFYKRKLENNGGRDYPPCWVSDDGKVEFLFSVTLYEDNIDVVPAWPKHRENAARKLPNLNNIIANHHSFSTFSNQVTPILNWSKQQDPECRHYVRIKSNIQSAVKSDRIRLMVENYFYKYEILR